MDIFQKIKNSFKSKLHIINLTCILCIGITFIPSYKSFAATAPPDTVSKGSCMLDGDTGQALYGQNIDTRYYPASTTKILTALVVLEHANLDDTVTIGTNPPSAEGTSVGIRATEKYTVRELLLGLILMSGNDCANALAEYVSGSEADFANLMNQKAAELGCVNSHFCNPSGLPDQNHYTTPRDLALIMKACIHNNDFLDIAQTKGYTLPASPIDGNTIPIDNHNYIMFNYYPRYYYEGAIASKKGYTIAAQFTNVIAAKRGNTTLVGAFLKGTDINETYKDVHTVFDYGFQNFERQTLYTKDETIGDFKIDDDTYSLKPAEDVYYTCDITQKENIDKNIEYEIPSDINDTDFKAGDKIVTADVIVNGEKVQTIDLVSDSDLKIKDKIYEDVKNPKTSYVFIAVIIGLAIMGTSKFIYNKKFKTENKKSE